MNDRLIYYPGRPHPIISLVIDIYFLAPIVISFINQSCKLFGFEVNDYVNIFLYIFIFTIFIIYHSNPNIINKKLSPGELITGKKIINSQKIWTNPYRSNRWLLFAPILLSVIFIGGYGFGDFIFNNLIRDNNIFIELMILSLIFIFYNISFIFIGHGGKILFLSIPIVINISYIIFFYIEEKVKTFYDIFYDLICLFLFTIALVFYTIKRGKKKDIEEDAKIVLLSKQQKYSWIKLSLIAYIPIIIGFVILLISHFLYH